MKCGSENTTDGITCSFNLLKSVSKLINFVCAVVEILENLAYLANASNLVLYLSENMHLSPSKSANNVTIFMGTAFLLALPGGFLSDAFLTTYHIYLISAVVEFLVHFSFDFTFLFFKNIKKIIECSSSLIVL